MAAHKNRIYTFPNDSMSYEVLSWDEMTNLLFLVSQKITTDGKKFDRIVSLAKGGWPMARMVADFLNIREASSIGTRSYSGIGEQTGEVEVYQDLHDIKGQDLLLLDDVSDTGKTLKFVYEYLQKKGARSITTATVYYKPHSVFKPDYYGAETSSWIIFPYEIVETALLLHEKWGKQHISDQEMEERLETIGCREEWQQFLGIDPRGNKPVQSHVAGIT